MKLDLLERARTRLTLDLNDLGAVVQEGGTLTAGDWDRHYRTHERLQRIERGISRRKGVASPSRHTTDECGHGSKSPLTADCQGDKRGVATSPGEALEEAARRIEAHPLPANIDPVLFRTIRVHFALLVRRTALDLPTPSMTPARSEEGR